MGLRELSGKPDEMLGGDLAMDRPLIQGRIVILLVSLCQEAGISFSWVVHWAGVQTLATLHTHSHFRIER